MLVELLIRKVMFVLVEYFVDKFKKGVCCLLVILCDIFDIINF